MSTGVAADNTLAATLAARRLHVSARGNLTFTDIDIVVFD
jgi:hypothetical protein